MCRHDSGLEWNYLRVRGEYTRRPKPNGKNKELPPRARRIQDESDEAEDSPGTTSACAENTGGSTCGFLLLGNYLRVRGEYIQMGLQNQADEELPPRARRIHR